MIDYRLVALLDEKVKMADKVLMFDGVEDMYMTLPNTLELTTLLDLNLTWLSMYADFLS